MAIVIIFSVIVLLFLFFGPLRVIKERQEQKKYVSNSVQTIDNFNPTKIVRETSHPSFYFAIDEARCEVMCVSNMQKIRFKYENIVNVEMQVSRKSAQKVIKMSIHILLRNLAPASFDIMCIEDYAGLEAWQPNYKERYSKAQTILDNLMLIVDKNNQVKKEEGTMKTNISSSNQIDELKNLAQLKQQGVITEEEFIKLKEKVISG